MNGKSAVYVNELIDIKVIFAFGHDDSLESTDVFNRDMLLT